MNGKHVVQVGERKEPQYPSSFLFLFPELVRKASELSLRMTDIRLGTVTSTVHGDLLWSDVEYCKRRRVQGLIHLVPNQCGLSRSEMEIRAGVFWVYWGEGGGERKG